jgi:hypothetical protein
MAAGKLRASNPASAPGFEKKTLKKKMKFTMNKVFDGSCIRSTLE